MINLIPHQYHHGGSSRNTTTYSNHQDYTYINSYTQRKISFFFTHINKFIRFSTILQHIIFINILHIPITSTAPNIIYQYLSPSSISDAIVNQYLEGDLRFQQQILFFYNHYFQPLFKI